MKTQIRIAIVAAAALASSVTLLAQADVYKSKCAMCHGPTGAGSAPMKVPAVSTMKGTEAEMIAITKAGKPPKMPSYTGKLTDAQIKSTVEYMRTLK